MKVKIENRALTDSLKFPALLHDTHNRVWLFMSEDSCGFYVNNEGELEPSTVKISSTHPWRRYNGSITLENS